MESCRPELPSSATCDQTAALQEDQNSLLLVALQVKGACLYRRAEALGAEPFLPWLLPSKKVAVGAGSLAALCPSGTAGHCTAPAATCLVPPGATAQ
mmetsp:Transcript_41547/g.90524  ORF Transcript_41547/g.90524 Transcript_41547/m.90524 type:complete len:97 (+) Transcript_41547:1248-1538(+)